MQNGRFQSGAAVAAQIQGRFVCVWPGRARPGRHGGRRPGQAGGLRAQPLCGQHALSGHHPARVGPGGRGDSRRDRGRGAQRPAGRPQAHHGRRRGLRAGRARELRRRQHRRRGEGGRGPADAGRRHRGIFRHRPRDEEAAGDRQEAHSPRGGADRLQLRRAPDQVLEHHRRAHGAEEAHRGHGHRAPAAAVRLCGQLRLARGPDRRRRPGRDRPLPGGALLGGGQAGIRPGGAGGRHGHPARGESSAARARPSPRRRGTRGAGPGHRPGRLRHHDRRDQRRPPDQFLAHRRHEPRSCLRDAESVLHRLLCPGHRGAAAAGRQDFQGRGLHAL